jgi:hypothetical protein
MQNIRMDRLYPLTPPVEPTFGISSAYVPQPYPRHVYSSRTESVIVNNEAEEQAHLEAGYKSSYGDFEEAPAPPNEVQTLKDALAQLQAQVADLTSRRK